MINYWLNIGEVRTSAGNVNFTCFGLGSCIGLFLQDRSKGISGGAHIFLPGRHDSTGISDRRFYDVSSALDEILKQFAEWGSDLTTLRAKLAGGANVLNSDINTGEQNIRALRAELVSRKIYIAATDVGGNHSRTVLFDGISGQLTVRVPNTKKIWIY